MEGLKIAIIKTAVKRHTRKNKRGKPYVVKKHKRKKRKLGKKLRYKTIGRFQVAHDEFGNFRGSRVLKYKKLTSKAKPKKVKPLKLNVKKKKKTKKRKSRSKKTIRKRPRVSLNELKVPTGASINVLDTKFYLGKIDENSWLEARRKLTG